MKSEKAVFCFLMWLDFAVTKDVNDLHTSLDQSPSDQNAAMTFKRLVLRTHERHASVVRTIEDRI
jgi:hypothetical protein